MKDRSDGCFFHLFVGSEDVDKLSLVFVHFDSLVHVLSFLLLGGNVESLDFRLFLSDSLAEGLSLFGGGLRAEKGSSSEGLGIRIQFDHHSQIAQRVLLVDSVLLGSDLLAKMGLDLLRVDDATEIRVGDLGLRKSESNLEFRRLLEGSIKLVEFLEGSSCPDDETAQMTSGRKLKEIQSTNRAHIHSGDVSEGAEER
jgi:hypothetical protein